MSNQALRVLILGINGDLRDQNHLDEGRISSTTKY